MSSTTSPTMPPAMLSPTPSSSSLPGDVTMEVITKVLRFKLKEQTLVFLQSPGQVDTYRDFRDSSAAVSFYPAPSQRAAVAGALAAIERGEVRFLPGGRQACANLMEATIKFIACTVVKNVYFTTGLWFYEAVVRREAAVMAFLVLEFLKSEAVTNPDSQLMKWLDSDLLPASPGGGSREATIRGLGLGLCKKEDSWAMREARIVSGEISDGEVSEGKSVFEEWSFEREKDEEAKEMGGLGLKAKESMQSLLGEEPIF